jgi:hypothetical protein
VTVTDWDGIGWDNLYEVTEKIVGHDYLVHVYYNVPTGTHARKDGTFAPVALVTFDGDLCRDTWVHEWCCRYGYLAVVNY